MTGSGQTGRGVSSSETTVDPTQQAINTHALEELQAGRKAVGGMGSIAERQPLALYNNDELGILRQIMARGNEPVMRPEEMEGLNTLRQMMTQRPDDQIAAARGYFNEIGAPGITAQMTASGYGRSGAMGEALGRGAAEMTLPIYQQSEANRFQAGQGYAAANLGLGTQLEERQVNRQYDALDAAGAPRLNELQEILRPQQSYFSLLSGMPIVTGSTTYGRNRNNQTGWQGGIGLQLCWVAEALWGADSAKTLYARYYVTVVQPQTVVGKLAKMAYRKLGRFIAKTPLRFALRGVLSRCADKGRMALMGE